MPDIQPTTPKDRLAVHLPGQELVRPSGQTYIITDIDDKVRLTAIRSLMAADARNAENPPHHWWKH